MAGQSRIVILISATVFLLETVCILLVAITTFVPVNSNQAIADLKIDTRNASVDDILGGIKFKPTLTATTTRSSYYYNSYYTRSSISASSLQTANVKLEAIKQVLSEEKRKYPNFSIARAFSIHDDIRHSVGSYSCSSQDGLTVGYLRNRKQLTSCSMNGLLLCLGRSNKSSLSTPPAMSIERAYIMMTSSLNSSQVTRLSTNWSTVMTNAIPYTITANLGSKVYSQLLTQSCPDSVDFQIREDHYNGSKNPTFILGVFGFVCTDIVFLICWLARFNVFAWIYGFFVTLQLAVTAAQAAVMLKYTSNVVKSYTGSMKITATMKGFSGSGPLVIATLVLQAIIFLLSLCQLIIYISKKKRERDEAKQQEVASVSRGKSFSIIDIHPAVQETSAAPSKQALVDKNVSLFEQNEASTSAQGNIVTLMDETPEDNLSSSPHPLLSHAHLSNARSSGPPGLSSSVNVPSGVPGFEAPPPYSRD